MSSDELAWGVHDLARLMTLEEVAPDQFINVTSNIMPGYATYGGQLIAHALLASMKTAEDRVPHSSHAYFLGGADAKRPVNFSVKRLRDGNRFASRQVEASQGDSLIMQMMTSLCRPSPSVIEHQMDAVPAPPPPETCEPFDHFARRQDDPIVLLVSNRLKSVGPEIELRYINELSFIAHGQPLRRRFWFRLPGASSIADPAIHLALLSYLSDFWLAGTTLMAHHTFLQGDYPGLVSLDHAIWFHRACRVDEWLLYQVDSPNLMSGIGLARGLIYDRAGRLLASTAQEAMPRIKPIAGGRVL
jgi:acyl-CoA thioesterase-2